MTFPKHIEACLDALEQAGYAAYGVGGCVRDACLGKTPQDYDLCTAAPPEETCRIFGNHTLVLAGLKHGTVGVVTPEGVVEITTFRTEGSYQDNRHPDWVAFVENVEEDLARRDFTINAMAYSPKRGFADPFGGRQDLKDGILRAVGNPRQRFQEDSLRILRGLRFAVRFGLAVEPETAAAMAEQRYLMENLARERVFEELSKLLPLITPEALVAFGPVLAAVIPELKPMLGFDQHCPYHAYDLFTHTAYVVGGVPGNLALRWAALLHDVGKVPTFTQDETGRGHFLGHAQVSAQMASEILLRLKAPTALRQQVVTLIQHHMTPIPPEKRLVRRWLAKLSQQGLEDLLRLQEADGNGKGTGESGKNMDEIRNIMAQIQQEEGCLSLKTLAVNGNDLMALGYRGRAIGQKLQHLLELVMDEKLPNQRQALLDACHQKGEPL